LNGLVAGCHCFTGATPGAGLGETLGRWRIATVCLVPTLLHRLATEFRNAEVTTLPDLRLVVYGGSRAIVEDVSLLESTGARTAQIFGLSETGCTALCLPTGPGSVDRVRRGQVGRPYPGVDIRVLGDPAETPLTHRCSDPEGTLWIRTPAAMLGYHADPAATAAALVDGWVNTGDRVTVDGDGFITLRGRVSELIICGGANVMPDDVDRIAVTVHGVKDAASFEIPDPSFGAVVGLVVVPTDSQAQEGTGSGRRLKRSVAAEFRLRAEAEARPAHIRIVERIPRTASGKIRRGKLTARFTGRSESVVDR
uniref:AMP-binding protein n=1 Tax=uncultured Corynebacterium sp. TaxID=159447 RepID=UPI0025D7C93F